MLRVGHPEDRDIRDVGVGACPEKLDLARPMRNAPTSDERVLWRALRGVPGWSLHAAVTARPARGAWFNGATALEGIRNANLRRTTRCSPPARCGVQTTPLPTMSVRAIEGGRSAAASTGGLRRCLGCLHGRTCLRTDVEGAGVVIRPRRRECLASFAVEQTLSVNDIPHTWSFHPSARRRRRSRRVEARARPHGTQRSSTTRAVSAASPRITSLSGQNCPPVHAPMSPSRAAS